MRIMSRHLRRCASVLSSDRSVIVPRFRLNLLVDNPGTILTIFALVVGLLATAGYGAMSVAQYRAARVAFVTTAVFFAAIGIELGLVMAWPLGVKIAVAGCFGFAAAGALVYALHSVSLLDKPKVEQPARVPPDAPKPPQPLIIADCYETDYPSQYPTNGMMYALINPPIHGAPSSNATVAIVGGQPGQALTRPRKFARAARCDFSVHGDLPLFNVTLAFKLTSHEFFIEKAGGGYRGHSGKELGSNDASIHIRKIDVYPVSYTVYFENRSDLWVTIDPPPFASSISSLTTGDGYNVEVRRTNNIQLSVTPLMPDPGSEPSQQ